MSSIGVFIGYLYFIQKSYNMSYVLFSNTFKVMIFMRSAHMKHQGLSFLSAFLVVMMNIFFKRTSSV